VEKITGEGNNLKDNEVQKETVLFIGSDILGRGNSELGKILMRNFIHTLCEQANPPSTIILMNAGVKMAASGSPVIEELTLLQEKGVTILACGTCLDYYKLKNQLKAGQISNMHDITAILLARPHLITLS